MSNTRRTRSSEPGWKQRKHSPIRIRRKIREKRQGRIYLYNVMTDGSVRRVESDRMVRREFGLSPRQYRKAKRASWKEAEGRMAA